MGRNLPHTGTHRGKLVRVKLRGGAVIIAKFHERNDRYVFLEGHSKISKADIESFSNYKRPNDPNQSADGSIVQGI